MNKSKTLFILLIFLGTTFSCCKDDEDEKIEPKKYPYFSCIINGEEFFHARGNWQCYPWTFNYYPNGFLGAPEGYTVLAGKDCSSKNIGIRIYGFIPTVDTLNFLSTQVDSVSPFYRNFDLVDELGQSILFDELVSGSIKFNEFSDRSGETDGIVSGTFEFTVHNSEIDSTVEITDGKFQYIIDYEWY